MNPTQRELEMSRLFCIIDEIKSRGRIDSRGDSAWRGYHTKAYNKGVSQVDLNRLTMQVCGRLKEMTRPQIQGYSLELQIWWRDHQEWDKERDG